MQNDSSSIHPKVLSVRHWNNGLFSFTTERPTSFKFEAGQFVMIGLPDDNGKPIMRAYSLVSPPWQDHLEFLSIAVPDGPLTSRLKNIKPGDEINLNPKTTGTLVHTALTPGKNLFLFGTGTGVAPWLSIVRDPETYERFEHVYLCHGVREVKDLAYRELLETDIFNDELLNEVVDGGLKGRLIYYPTVTRETFRNQGRLTDLIESGKLFSDLGLSQTCFNPETDRVMVCGNVQMNQDIEQICERHGLTEGATNQPGSFVVERAFVEKKPKPETKISAVSHQETTVPGAGAGKPL